MDINYYARYFAFESDDWWFIGRRRIVLGLLEDALARADPAQPGERQLLDAGAGTGVSLSYFAPLGKTIGIDISREAIRFCVLRGQRNLLQADVTRIPVADDTFDVVLCLDVIEHITDDEQAVRELCRVCRPGGVVALTVPAFPFLWSEHDVINHHRRRYRRGRIARMITRAGLDIEVLSFYNFWLSPLATGLRLVKRLWTWAFPQVVQRIEADNTYLPRSINWLFAQIFSSELGLLRCMRLPYGISLVCIARKPAGVKRIPG